MTTANRGRPRRHDLATEQQMLLDAAVAVMKRNGLADATLQDILDEARLSTRAFYRHFESKNDVIIAVRRRDAEVLAERMRTRMSAADSAWSALQIWVDEILGVVFDRRRARRVEMVAAGYAAGDRPGSDADQLASIVAAPLDEVLRQGRSDGTMPGADPAADAMSIYVVCLEVLRRCRQGTLDFTRQQAAEHVLRFCRAATLPVGDLGGGAAAQRAATA